MNRKPRVLHPSPLANGEGRRVRAVDDGTTTALLYDGFNVLVERDASGQTLARNTWGLSLGGGIGGLLSRTSTSGTLYPLFDGSGNIVGWTDSAGASVTTTAYTAFGEVILQSGSPQPLGFSTKPLSSATGLVYFGARYYEPTIGRFTSTDPTGFIDGMNLYTYVSNNPVNLIDPVGLSGLGVGGQTVLSILQRGLGGALSVLDQPVELLRARVYTLYDANRGVFVRLEGHTYQVLRPFQHLKSTIQGLGLLLGGFNIVIDPIELAATGRIDANEARQLIAIRSLETAGNAWAAWYGAGIGSPAGPVGAAVGAMVAGTTSALLTRKAGDWVLETVLDVPVQ